MNKKELIAKISVEQNVPKARAEEIVNAIFSTIVDELKSGENVKIPGFGNFKVKTRKQRIAVIPNQSKRVIIPSYRVAKFLPSKNFREQVKE